MPLPLAVSAMFSSVQSHVETSIAQTLSSASVSSSRLDSLGKVVASNEQDVNFAFADLNVVEMSKAEYTQLQQILYPQMDPECKKGAVETGGGSAFYPVGSTSGVSQCHSATITSQSGFPSTISECQNVHPIVCPLVMTPASNMNTGQPLKNLEFQETRMMRLSASSLHLTGSNSANKAPNETGGDSSEAGTMQVRKDGSTTGTNVEKGNSARMIDSRLKSTVRVRLEDRFNRIHSEGSRGQEAQDSLSNPVSLIHHPSQHMEAQHHKCATLAKIEGSADTGILQFPYPCKSQTSSIGSCHTQLSASDSYGCSSPLQEETKLQEMSLPKNFSFCYQQEWKSANQNKLMPKQVWNTDHLVKQANNERCQSPQRQVDSAMDRRLLNEIQNLRDGQTIQRAKEVSWSPTQYNTGEPAPTNRSIVRYQSREKKNRMERDRRRKIRICCDKLNVLVPFCNVGTDKATTLQWTVAFLKYIQKQHGDSIKEEFESSYCEMQNENEKTIKFQYDSYKSI